MNNSPKQDTIETPSVKKGETNVDCSKKHSGCFAFTCSFKLFLRPSQEQSLIRCNGHLIFPYTQPAWCLSMCSMENNSRQPLCLLAQGYFCLLAIFSRVTFLVSKNLALHVGQHVTLCLHLMQMLWPFVHSFMGGTIYTMHTGHSRSLNRSLPTARDKSSISRT